MSPVVNECTTVIDYQLIDKTVITGNVCVVSKKNFEQLNRSAINQYVLYICTKELIGLSGKFIVKRMYVY
jgi:hypothetical protein